MRKGKKYRNRPLLIAIYHLRARAPALIDRQSRRVWESFFFYRRRCYTRIISRVIIYIINIFLFAFVQLLRTMNNRSRLTATATSDVTKRRIFQFLLLLLLLFDRAAGRINERTIDRSRGYIISPLRHLHHRSYNPTF